MVRFVTSRGLTVHAVYNASSGQAPPVTHAGNMVIQKLFTDFFDKHKLPYELNAFDGRSDYEGFIEANVPGALPCDYPVLRATALDAAVARACSFFCCLSGRYPHGC